MKTCSIDGCENRVHATCKCGAVLNVTSKSGLCRRCYQREWARRNREKATA